MGYVAQPKWIREMMWNLGGGERKI